MKTVNEFLSIKITPAKIIGLVFFVYTLGAFCVPMLGWNQRLLQLPLYAFFAVCLLFIKKSHVSSRFLLWYAPFVFICMTSSLYAVNFEDATSMFSGLLMALLFGLSASIFLSYDGAIVWIKYSYILVSLFVGIRLIMTFEQKSWWSRLGENFEMNENLVALYFLIPFCFALDEIQNKKQILLNLITLFVTFYVVLLTGSKKALFAVFIFAFLLSILKAGKITKKMRVLLATAISLVVVYHLVMNVELLYNVLGHRLEAMMETFAAQDGAGSDGSTGERGDMILFGLNLFLKSPIWGWGLNSFKGLYGAATGHYAYAHNNYVELLADLGIIGFAWYYSFLAKMLRYLTKLKGLIKENAFSISLLVVILFYDIAMVSYDDTRMILLTLIAFSGVYRSYREKREQTKAR